MRSPAFRAEGEDEERHRALAVYGERGRGPAVGDTWAERQRVGVPLPQVAEQVGLVCLDLAAQRRRGRGGVATVSNTGSPRVRNRGGDRHDGVTRLEVAKKYASSFAWQGGSSVLRSLIERSLAHPESGHELIGKSERRSPAAGTSSTASIRTAIRAPIAAVSNAAMGGVGLIGSPQPPSRWVKVTCCTSLVGSGSAA